jgi:hypothetical protein
MEGAREKGKRRKEGEGRITEKDRKRGEKLFFIRYKKTS